MARPRSGLEGACEVSAALATQVRRPDTRGRARIKGGKKWNGAKWCWPSTRHAIYHRDGHACVYCARTEKLSLDHLTPEELGGTHEPTNLVTSCFSCNSARGKKTLRAWLRYLRERGVDTSKMATRIRRLVRRELDRAEGRRLAKERKAS